MKKFFSLVLALVMALSLTTVVWGVTPVTKTVGAGGDYTSLADAVAAAQDGWTIKLLEDVTVDNMVQLTLAGNVTIDGGGNKLSPSASFTPDYLSALIMLGDLSTTTPANCNYTLKNIVFDGFTAQNVVRISGVTALVSNCTFKNITSDAFIINVKDSDVDVNVCGFEGNACAGVVYAADSTGSLDVNVCSFVDNDVTTSTVGGYAVVYTSGSAAVTVTNNTFDENDVNSTASNGGVVYADAVTATGNTFTDNDVTASGERAGVVVADGGTVTGNEFSSDNTTTSNNATKYEATVVSKGDGSALDVSNNYWGDGAAPVEGVDYVNAKPAKANTFTATTYYTTATGGVLSGLTSNVPSTSNAAKYTLWGAKIAATATGVNYIATDMQLPDATKAVAPVAPALNGSVAYYTVFGTKYVQGTADDCDVYFTIKGKTVPVLYLKEIGSQNYIAAATEFTNFGKACGQVKVTPVAGTKYYTYTGANDIVYVYAQNVSTGAMANATDFLLVNNKMVPVVTTNLNTYKVPHSWAFSKNAKGVVDSAKCVDCGVTAAVYSTYTAVPTGADYIREGAYFLVINAPAVDTKVESAETFDAGIAMYVGMSIMAATGSAVVIGKKKD